MARFHMIVRKAFCPRMARIDANERRKQWPKEAERRGVIRLLPLVAFNPFFIRVDSRHSRANIFSSHIKEPIQKPMVQQSQGAPKRTVPRSDLPNRGSHATTQSHAILLSFERSPTFVHIVKKDSPLSLNFPASHFVSCVN
jgi:hypothetical protein